MKEDIRTIFSYSKLIQKSTDSNKDNFGNLLNVFKQGSSEIGIKKYMIFSMWFGGACLHILMIERWEITSTFVTFTYIAAVYILLYCLSRTISITIMKGTSP